MSEDTWTARDARRPGHFWADNEVYDHYARLIGVNAFAVYMALSRHANNEGICYPSHTTIGEELGLSRATIIRAIQTLERYSLIHTDIRRLPVRGQTTNVYTLLQVEKTAVAVVDSGSKTSPKKPKPLSTSDTPPVSQQQGVLLCDTPPVAVVDSHINNTYVNKTQLTTSSSSSLVRNHRPEKEEEENEIDDGGDEDDGIDPYETHKAEADRPNVKADLVDALAALGVYPGSARQAVMDGTVTSDRDVIRCKRSGLGAGVLWKEYLSQGKLPPLEETSSVPESYIAAARRMLKETDERNAEGDRMVTRFTPLANPLKRMDGTNGGIVRPPEGFWR